MNMIENITYFPEKLSKNSLAIINYFGFLNTSDKIYIEYSYDKDAFSNNLIRRAEMSKISDYSFALISLESADNLYFRFSDDFGHFDDNNGQFYQKEISSQEEALYTNSTTLLSEYEYLNLNNKSNIINKISNEDLHIDNFDETSSQTMALVPIKEHSLARKGLRFSYKLNKRIKLLLIKLFRKLPSFITGNYRRRINL